jgi:hypothetical protein
MCIPYDQPGGLRQLVKDRNVSSSAGKIESLCWPKRENLEQSFANAEVLAELREHWRDLTN